MYIVRCKQYGPSRFRGRLRVNIALDERFVFASKDAYSSSTRSGGLRCHWMRRCRCRGGPDAWHHVLCRAGSLVREHLNWLCSLPIQHFVPSRPLVLVYICIWCRGADGIARYSLAWSVFVHSLASCNSGSRTTLAQHRCRCDQHFLEHGTPFFRRYRHTLES